MLLVLTMAIVQKNWKYIRPQRKDGDRPSKLFQNQYFVSLSCSVYFGFAMKMHVRFTIFKPLTCSRYENEKNDVK